MQKPESMPPFLQASSVLSDSGLIGWASEDDTKVIESVNGITCAVHLKHGNVDKVAIDKGSGFEVINPYTEVKEHQIIIRAAQNANRSSFFYMYDNGWVLGHVVGPEVDFSDYHLEQNHFIPIDWVRRHCEYEDFPRDGTRDELINWFKNEAYSHLTARLNGLKPSEASVKNGYYFHGVLLINSDFKYERVRPSNIKTESSANIAIIKRDGLV